MKKALILPILLCSFALPSCGPKIANAEQVDQLKALLAKQDLSPIYDKMFFGTFTQHYEAYSLTHGEGIEEETQFYSYRGGGAFGCYYEVSEQAWQEVEELESHDCFDYLARGLGSYGMLQTAAMVSYHYGLSDEGKVESLQSLDFLQRLETVFGESSVQIYNSLSYKEALDGAYDHRQQFNGIIGKGALFDAITPRALSEILTRTNLYDGQRSCEALDRIYFDVLKSLSAKSDQELSSFIAENDVRIEEQGDSSLVRFKVGEQQLRERLEENDIIPGAFEGTLTYEKESGKFSAFDYKIVHLVHEANDVNGDIRTLSMEFKASGYSWKQKFEEDLYIQPSPTVYDDPEAFLEDVVEEVIPPRL